MKKWLIGLLCLMLVFAAGVLLDRNLRSKNAKQKRQEEFQEKMKTRTQEETTEEELRDVSSVSGYIDAKELAALEEACDYSQYQTNANGQTFGTLRMASVLRSREADRLTEQFRANHPEAYEELLSAIQNKMDNGIWDYNKEWNLKEWEIDGYDADKGLGIDYYFEWDESITCTEADHHLRMYPSYETWTALLPDLINVEAASFSSDPSAKSQFSVVAERYEPVAGYMTKEDYLTYWRADPEQLKEMVCTTYANDGVTALQWVRAR